MGTVQRMTFLSGFILGIALSMPAAATATGAAPPAMSAAEFIAALQPGPMQPADVRLVLGEPSASATGNQLHEGYRDGKLDALCTSVALSSSVHDKTLRVGNLRTEHYFDYETLGLRLVFLDNPWVLYRFEVSSPDVVVRGQRVGEVLGVLDDMHGGMGETCHRTGNMLCCEQYSPELRVYYSCSPEEVRDADAWGNLRKTKRVEKIEIMNTDLPTGCWLSFRGRYMPWTVEDEP